MSPDINNKIKIALGGFYFLILYFIYNYLRNRTLYSSDVIITAGLFILSWIIIQTIVEWYQLNQLVM